MEQEQDNAEEKQEDVIECHFCSATVATVDEAIAADWVPSFYDGDAEVCSPVCPTCQTTRLRVATDGELELIPPIESHPTTDDDSPPNTTNPVQHTIHSSYGDFVIDERGNVLSHELDDGWDQSIPVQFDVDEFRMTYGRLDTDIDVLDIGYTKPDGQYEPPSSEWRRDHRERNQT